MKAHIKKTYLVILSPLLFVFLLVFIFRFSPYPNLKRFLSSPISTRIYDRNGKLIQITSIENGAKKEYVSLNDMPPFLKQAFIQAEDKRFYEHFGVDFSAITRALKQNMKEKKIISGASTISMQLAALICPHKKNVLGKIKEAFDATRLEARYKKDKILEMYLSNLPFGFNTVGVASAARTFFACEIRDLSFEQALCLAVIPRSPKKYNPLRHPLECADAAYELFLLMKKECNEEYLEKNITKEGLLQIAKKAKSFSYPFYMPHYIRYLLHGDNGISKQPSCHLSCDLSLYIKARGLLHNSIEEHKQNRISNGAVLICDTQTGEILCWVGSEDFENQKSKGQIDGVSSLQQAGSCMKPFLYALCLENGFSPSSVLPDVPFDFGKENLYAPQNFNNRFSGPVRLRVALASSLNVPSVFLLNMVGKEKYDETLQRLHFDSLEKNKSRQTGLSLALGAGEVSLFELVQGFCIFARDGLFLPLIPFEKESAKKDKTQRVFSCDVCRIICDILQDSSSRATGFGFGKAFSTPFSAIFKTGTANQYQSIVALASTPLYTVGVRMGNFSGETVMGKTGSDLPRNIARDLLIFLQNQKDIPFAKPIGWQKKDICSLSGLSPGPFCQNMTQEYVRKGMQQKICHWHTKNGTEYPKEYAQWLSAKNRAGTIRQEELGILSPKDGSVFFQDESLPFENQKMTLQVAGGDGMRYDFFVDGKFCGTVFFDEKTYHICKSIPLTQGKHIATVTSGGESKSIHFVVK